MASDKPAQQFLLPAIDLLGGRVVRLVRGDYEQLTEYPGRPVDVARQFEDAGASWIHVVDLDGARSGVSTHLDEIRDLCEHTGLYVEVGGGVRSEKSIRNLLEAGVSRVIVGTAALQNWPWFERLMTESSFEGRLVLGLDARKGKLAVSGWQTTTEHTPREIAGRLSHSPLAAIVYTDIATDGTLEGPNLDATQALTEATDVPIIASGGVGTLDDLRQLAMLPIHGAICGKALYEQRFSLAEAIEAFEGNQTAYG